ncbi:NAD-P-bindingprotein [Moniliophthora roreri MCA 2997]|uniref:NAD-P-bindingprotein n=1 Tax=Moniliophthora roreri (strain MCA 2997) TaxID=1381753 RepID=V2YK80_MONRO|nr:NAD-P-bindingprotein [Moniliophthora roreri MCA 2997]
MSTSPQTIFVTGTTGFIGSHVLDELLKQGYRVKCAVRPGAKTEHMKSRYSFELETGLVQIINMPDISTAQLQGALEGVDAVIHLASPPGRATAEQTYQGSVEGSLNLLRQAESAGIKRVVITGMIPVKLQHTLTKDEVFRSDDPFAIYESCKILAEQAIWEWARLHPHVDIALIALPLTYGPYTSNFYLPTPAFPGVNTFLYQLIVPDGIYCLTGQYVDVRDAAKAHVGALKSPLVSSLSESKKQIVFGSPQAIQFKEAVAVLSDKRPALQERLIRSDAPTSNEGPLSCDYERIEQMFGVKKQEFIPFEKTLLDTIDDYVSREGEWIRKGYQFEMPHY